MSERRPVPRSELDDHDLMACLVSGDDLALNTLMQRWSDRVLAFLFRMTGRHDTAVDLAQETFVRLYQSRDRYRPGRGKFSTWLFAIASNLARNHARWRSRHPEVPLDPQNDEGSNSFPEPCSAGIGPDEAVISRETEHQVLAAIQALPHDLRDALVLFTNEQLSYVDIARIKRCTTKTVETRIYRARQILKDRLKNLRA